jgi:type IV pilus assembly protein PilM
MLRKGYKKFFPTPKFLSRPSFGLDISDESVKFIEFLETRKGIRIGHFGERAIPPGVIESGKIAEAKRLKEILLRLRKEENINLVRASLPEEQIYLFRLKLPKEGAKNIREMIELSLEEHVPVPPAEVVFDYELFQEDEQYFDVEVAAVPKAIIETYLSIFTNCGFVVPSFELEAQALARAVIKNGDKDVYMIVDCGKKRTGISIVDHGVVALTSTVDMGGVMLTKLIEKNFKVSFEEAEKMKIKYGLTRNTENQEVFSTLLNGVSIIRDEVDKHFIYWHTHKDEDGKDRPPVKKIILCGGDSNLIGFAEYLSISMRQNVELANVWLNVASPGDYIPEMSFESSLSYATAIGLALADLEHK